MPELSPLEQLRKRHQRQWLSERRHSVARALASVALPDDAGFQVLLFGSRARGDWDGASDTDLLVVAPTRAVADLLADHLLEAGLGDDVIALSSAEWQAAEHSPSPHWRSIRAQAIPLHERPSRGLVAPG